MQVQFETWGVPTNQVKAPLFKNLVTFLKGAIKATLQRTYGMIKIAMD
jgi:hypothetical protein